MHAHLEKAMKVAALLIMTAGVCVVVGGSLLNGQTANDDIKSVAAQFLRSLSDKNWQSAAEATHKDDKEYVKDKWTAFLKSNRDLPFAIAIVPKGKTLTDVLDLSPDEFYKAFLASFQNSEVVLGDFRKGKGEILGTVFEKEATAHLIVRMTYDDPNVLKSKLLVLSLSKDGNRWKCHLPQEIKIMIDTLASRSSIKNR